MSLLDLGASNKKVKGEGKVSGIPGQNKGERPLTICLCDYLTYGNQGKEGQAVDDVNSWGKCKGKTAWQVRRMN